VSPPANLTEDNSKKPCRRTRGHAWLWQPNRPPATQDQACRRIQQNALRLGRGNFFGSTLAVSARDEISAFIVVHGINATN
jgi:hypothetical protein